MLRFFSKYNFFNDIIFFIYKYILKIILHMHVIEILFLSNYKKV